MRVVCDFHNHTCLSPCGSLEQPPSVLARLAALRGVGLVAVTDHNSALNAPAFAECARREGIRALYGMEATSAEEAHLVCLFATPERALDFGEFLSSRLPSFELDPELLGDQAVVDADDNVLDLPDIWFGAALDLGWDDLCRAASERGAIVIPAHIDRPMFGVISQLGFLPDGPYDAVEALRPLAPGAARGYPVVSGSDAHHPEHIARRPFSIELPEGWEGEWDSGGGIDLEAVRAALSAGTIRLPYGP